MDNQQKQPAANKTQDDWEPTVWQKRRWVGVLLGVLALLLMTSAAIYQRRTGPTYPMKGSYTISGQQYDFKLIRTHETEIDAPIEIPNPGGDVSATLYWKRLGVDEPHSPIPMLPEHREATDEKVLGLIPVHMDAHDVLVARLPFQPPAGKLEYYITLNSPEGQQILPSKLEGEEGHELVIRFKGAVPGGFLIPHVFFMFFGMLFGMRTFLGAIFNRRSVRWMAWTTLALLFVGGLIFGPIVQLYAFGEAWTGVPFGWDLTDNKTLIMFVVWLGGCLAIGLKGRPKPWSRAAIIVAGIVMIGTYLIPHSMYGSTLDYAKLEEGVDPVEAVTQG